MTPPPHEGHLVSSCKLAVAVAKQCKYHALLSEPGKKSCVFSGVAADAIALFFVLEDFPQTIPVKMFPSKPQKMLPHGTWVARPDGTQVSVVPGLSR